MSDTFVDSEKPTEADKAPPTEEQLKAVEPEVEKPVEKVEAKEPPERDEKGKFVPHGAFHEEREKRKEFQGKWEQTERARQEEKRQSEERFARLEARFKSLASPPPPPPDPRQDFDGYMEHKLAPLTKFVEETARERQERQAQERENAGRQQFEQSVRSREAEFAKATPDYEQAAEHWKAERVKELIETGVDDAEAMRTMNGELLWAAEKSLRAGKNPAEVLYSRAKRMGYKAPEKQADKNDGAMDAMERAQRASRSLGNAAGSAPSGEKLSVQKFADMSDEEVSLLYAKHGVDAVRRMLAS